ncbi:DUF6624 domain-containing protein [Nocardioides marinquilinus]
MGRRPTRLLGSLALALACAALAAGCADDEPAAAPTTSPASSPASSPTTEPAGPSATPPSPSAPSGTPTPTDPEQPVDEAAALRRELLGMLRRDQGERTGGATSDETDVDRTERLKEILDQYGWPGWDLVGGKAETAAWAIAQHSDLDPAFQAEALELLRAEVAEGNASPGNLAYLEDRVNVGQGRPQRYGTQVGCARAGPRPATPIRDRAGLEQRRRAAGLDPYADYLAEMTRVCGRG